MSQIVNTPHLGEKYEGVQVGRNIDTTQTGMVRPSGLSKLKEIYERLPNDISGNEKVGLTDYGYAVYRNTVNGALGYYYIVIRNSGVNHGRFWYRDESRKPDSEFGDKWLISP